MRSGIPYGAKTLSACPCLYLRSFIVQLCTAATFPSIFIRAFNLSSSVSCTWNMMFTYPTGSFFMDMRWIIFFKSSMAFWFSCLSLSFLIMSAFAVNSSMRLLKFFTNLSGDEWRYWMMVLVPSMLHNIESHP